MSRLWVATSASALLLVGSPPAAAHVPDACVPQVDQLGAHYDEREGKLVEVDGFVARFNEMKQRADSVTKLEMAQLLADFFLWAGDYVTHEGTTAATMSRLLGCVQGEQ